MKIPLESDLFCKNQKKFWESSKVKERRMPDHPVIASFAKPKIDFILEELNKLDEKSEDLEIIDVGCGNGYLSYYLEKEFKKLVCVDFSQAILELNPCQNKIKAAAECLPFPDKSFDIAFCSNTLHHLGDPILAIKEMKRVARKYIIISDMNRKNLIVNVYSLIKKEERGIIALPKKYFDLYFKEIGAEIIAQKDTGLILPNLTREFMLPLLKIFEKNKFLSPFYSIVLAKV